MPASHSPNLKIAFTFAVLFAVSAAMPSSFSTVEADQGVLNVTTTGVAKKTVTIGGLKCDKIQTGTVFFPTDASKTYPLLSFAHGWTEGGPLTDGNYADLLETVAATGYVVIAHHSGLVTECQDIYPQDQQRAIAFIKETAEFTGMVDWSFKVGIYGHSMGGGATGDNAADVFAIKKYNLGAAVLLHPVARNTRPKIPTFYATGSNDHICSAASVEAWSQKAAKPTVFAEMTGANHFECQSKEDGIPCPHGWTNYVIHWFNCYIKGNKDECTAAFSVCSHPTKPMTKCIPQPSISELHELQPSTAPSANTSNHHILIFGDSWGQFASIGGVLPAMLRRHGVQDTTVSSTAVSGSTACEWAERPESLANAVASSKADFVWFTLGGNDLLNPARGACLRAKCTQQNPWNCPCDVDTYVPKVLGCAEKLLDSLFKRFPDVKVLNFFYDIPCLKGVGCFPDMAAPDCGHNASCVIEGQKFWQQSYSEALGARYTNLHSINLLGTAQAAGNVPGASTGNPVGQGSPCNIMSVICEHPSLKGWQAESEAMWNLFFSKYLKTQ